MKRGQEECNLFFSVAKFDIPLKKMPLSCTIVEILFPKQPLRAMALEIISVHEIEVSEGVSIFLKKRKINILLLIE